MINERTSLFPRSSILFVSQEESMRCPRLSRVINLAVTPQISLHVGASNTESLHGTELYVIDMVNMGAEEQ